MAAGTDCQLRQLVESVTEYALFMLSPGGVVLTWHAGAERLKGYRPDEIIGKPFSVFYSSEANLERLPERALELATRQGHFEDEGWRVRKDGSQYWASVAISLVQGQVGAPPGFAVVIRDVSQQRAAELAVHKRNLHLEAILDCLSDAVAVSDTQGKFTHVNRAGRDLAGGARAEGDGIEAAVRRYGIFLPDGVTPYPLGESKMLRALKGEASDAVEALMRNSANPEGVALSVNTRPLLDEQGQVTGAVVVAHDITGRKRGEQELLRQKALLQSVLDCVVETVSVFDLEGRLIMANPAFQTLAGTFAANASVEERFKRYGLFDADGETRLPMTDTPARRAMRGEVVEELELVIRSEAHPNGVVMSTNAQCLFDTKGAIIGAVVTGRDVTARKEAERKLLDQKNMLESILDCLAEGVLVYDQAGMPLLTNPAAERLIDRGTPRDTPLEERIKAYGVFTIDGATTLAFGETPAAKAFRGESIDDFELLIRSQTYPDGIPLSTNSRPLRDESGKLLGAVVTLRDIAARRRAEHEREALLLELRRSNKELAQFAYVASHDLRSPLRAIGNLAKWLEEDLKPHFNVETAEQMQLLKSRVMRMDRLLGDLLEFSRLDRAVAAVTTVDVSSLVSEVVDIVGIPAGFRVIRDVTVARVETAQLPLKRTLLNLLTNAIKHHDRSEGEIRMSAHEQDGSLRFEVADDGPGIPRQFHQRIFEMFQTLKSRDDREASGMGLAFVKKIVDRAGGTVTVESAGRGATFRVQWPKLWPAHEP